MNNDVSQYELTEVIGRGGAGTVYNARDRDTGRSVALKLFNNLVANESLEMRFRAEVEIVASLEHPHIVPVYHSAEMDGRPYFTMKLLESETLAERLSDFSDPPKAAALLVKISSAVHFAHQRGILHRDLKPSNILLDQDDEPYVSDFGIAKRMNEKLDLTSDGALIGTPAYMSPEQARGDHQEISTASDLFSLGAILYHLLTGEFLYKEDVEHQIIRKLLVGSLAEQSVELKKIHPDLARICLKCVQAKRVDRYSSVAIFSEDLARYLRGEPVKARPLGPLKRSAYWCRRNPFKTFLFFLALIPISFVTGWNSLRLWRGYQAKQMTWTFDHDLENWTQIYAIEGEFEAFKSSSPRVGLDSDYKKDRYMSLRQFGMRDSPHEKSLWMRSPEFTLSKEDVPQISFSLLGSFKLDAEPPLTDQDERLHQPSQKNGWMGLALRRVGDGRYLLHGTKTKSSHHFFEKIIWNSQQVQETIKGDDPDELYTLDLIDTYHGEWGWVALNSVWIR